jgi:regulator of RNase E activity RraA
VPVECAGIRVCHSDIVFSDADGCMIIPRFIEDAVLFSIIKKLKVEKGTLDAGTSLSDVFQEYGVL